MDVDVLVWRRLALAPKQEPLFGRHLLDGNVLDGETQNDGPDHTQSHLGVAVDDFFLLKIKGEQKFINIFDNSLCLWCLP